MKSKKIINNFLTFFYHNKIVLFKNIIKNKILVTACKLAFFDAKKSLLSIFFVLYRQKFFITKIKLSLLLKINCEIFLVAPKFNYDI